MKTHFEILAYLDKKKTIISQTKNIYCYILKLKLFNLIYYHILIAQYVSTLD